MKITKPLLRRNRHEHRFHLYKLPYFCVYAGFLLVFVCVAPLLRAEDTEVETPTTTANGVAAATENNAREAKGDENSDGTGSNNGSTAEPTTEKITGTSKRMERYDKEGITILIDEAKTVRYNEQDVEIGFLNADRITIKTNKETGATTEIVAVGNVEIRDLDIFATCDHATMDNLTNTVILKENVVVLQNKDRLETKLFTFNRTTGKQTGDGGVKFKVTVTQAEPVKIEADAGAESSANIGEEGTSITTPGETEGEVENEEVDTETSKANSDAKETDVDTGNSENSKPQEETDTNTDNPEAADADAETEESESN